MRLTPIVFLQLLADRSLNPGSVRLKVGEGDLNGLLPLTADERFPEFVSEFPCLIDATHTKDFPPELLATLLSAGCELLPDGLVCDSDAQTKPELAPGAQWLTGNWYLAPPPRMTGRQAASRTLSLKLLQRVAADADTHEIEAIFREDPVLAYHLLRLVNSLGVGVGRSISSFSQAILILGRQQLKRWLNLMLFAAGQDDYRSAMLLAQVTVRARHMELLAKAGGLDRSTQDQAFMAGMFSLLGTLFGIPLSEVLEPLNLNATLSAAVLRGEGELGRLLRCAECIESSDEAQLHAYLDDMNVSATDLNFITLEAHQWMLGVIHDKQDVADA